jgi:hypothetical protein
MSPAILCVVHESTGTVRGCNNQKFPFQYVLFAGAGKPAMQAGMNGHNLVIITYNRFL